MLTKLQEYAKGQIILGKNVLLTGAGGTGKTFIVKHLYKMLIRERIIGLTSTTGVSAVLLGGKTLHSFLGIGIGHGSAMYLYKKIKSKKFMAERWKKLDMLFIDEVSMLSPDLFDKLNEIAKKIRRNPKPFGGIQLILVGDFCFAGNTKILLHNGSVTEAQNIKIGDYLMGDDSKPRIVTKLFRGKAQMYSISMPRGGESFVVTGNHILCMKPTLHKQKYWLKTKNTWVVYWWDVSLKRQRSKTFWVKKYDNDKQKTYEKAIEFLETIPDISTVEITVNEYNNLKTTSQNNLACYKVGVEWDRDYTLKIPPWLLGAWLGDGHSDGKGFTNNDKECIDEFIRYLEDMGCRVEKYIKAPYRYLIRDYQYGKRSIFKKFLAQYNLLNNKHIPDIYMYSSKHDRLELLAGYLDTDGSLTRNTFQISQTKKHLSEQICYLARSVGLSCSIQYNEQNNVIHINKKYPKYEQKTKSWRCHIGGDIHQIPCRVSHKKATELVDRQYNPLWMKIKVTPLEEDNFYGFETTGNRRFLLGDFLVTHNCQLPTVKSEKFCFEAESWEECVDEVIYFTENMRQNEDKLYQDILNKVRVGVVDEEVRRVLGGRLKKKLTNDNGIIPTKLFSLNRNVDSYNERKLDELANDGREFYSWDLEIKIENKKKVKKWMIDSFLKNFMAPSELQLAVGAQVMLIVNLDMENGGLANGSRGVVTRFKDDFPVVKFLNGTERVIDYYTWTQKEEDIPLFSVIQIPLKPAFGISIHKSQGSTIDYLDVDLGNVFEYGQAYVALSRVKSLEGLTIRKIDFDRIVAHPKALEFYENLTSH